MEINQAAADEADVLSASEVKLQNFFFFFGLFRLFL